MTSTTAPAPSTPAPTGASLLTLWRVETLDELRQLFREPTALVFSVAMPVAFFALFAGLYGGEMADTGVPVGTTMLATFGAFGVLSVAGLYPGIALADDRQSGWLRVKRTWAVPLPISLAAKVCAALPYALAVLGAMTAVAAAMGRFDLEPATWAQLSGLLLLGSLPFALLSLAVGAVATANGATAILNGALLPAAVAGGLWMPLDTLPEFVQHLAPWLPTYHLAQLATTAIDGTSALPHVAALLGFTVVAAALAAVTYRHVRS